MKKTVKACFQLLDNSVKEFSIQCSEKISKKEELNLVGQIGFRIIEIEEKEECLVGQIELLNDIEIFTQNEENEENKKKAKIHISMIGLFTANLETGKEKFETMLKINGASTLSHFIRAYIQSVTSLSGMPTVITPMINFVEFFNENDEK